MRYATFEIASPLGPLERVGALTAAGTLVDVTLAYARSLDGRVDPQRALALAEAVVPPDLLVILENGEVGSDAVAAAIDEVAGAAVGEQDSLGRTLVHDPAAVRLLAPIPRPTSIRDCSAYELHVANATRGNVPKRWYEIPAYYKGNPHSVIGTDEDVVVPASTSKLDYELEYAAVIGRRGRDLDERQSLAAIAGYLVFNDISARDLQFREMSIGLGPAKGKDLDGFNVLGPYLVTPDEWDPNGSHTMRALVDGEEWSSGSTDSIYFPVERIVSHISRDETLVVGDVIGTGTVGGGSGLEVGRYPQAGSVVEIEVEGLGRLRNRWVAP